MTYERIPSYCGTTPFKPIQLDDFSEQVGGTYSCLVRLTFQSALEAPRLDAVVQCNRGALPYLSPGRNRITVAVADAAALGGNRLAVSYAYRTGSRDKSYEELAESDAEIARAHNASWSPRPTVVRKISKAGDLPATFDIDVPTPAGKFPVYPRMLFLRREVLAPGAEPEPLPEGAAPPAAVSPAELKTVPNPFTTGIAQPPRVALKKTTTRTFPLRAGPAVSIDGESRANHFLKWKPKETWVMLVGGDLPGLPPAGKIAAARLVFPVARGNPQSATRVGVTLLAAPLRPGDPFDFKDLGDVAGSVVVPRQAGESDDTPPKAFAVDVTRAVKRLAAASGPLRGFAIRVVPDRSTDEGYITRIDLPDSARPALELDLFDGK